MAIRKRYAVWALVVLMIVAMVAGCRTTTAPDAPKPAPDKKDDQAAPVEEKGPDYGGTMFIGVIGDATTFNPIHSSDVTSALICDWTQMGMMSVDESLAFIAALSDRWESSPDGLVWTWWLRDGIVWQDGTPITTADVEFTFLAILHPEYTGVRQRNYDALLGADTYLTELGALGKKRNDGEISEDEYYDKAYAAYEAFKAAGAIKVVNDKEIRFTLERVHAPMMSNMSMGILPKHILKDSMGKEMKDHEHTRKPVGSGPWTVREWVTAEYISMLPSDTHYEGRPYLDEIVVKIIPDQNTLMVAVETGEIDVGAVTPEEFDRFEAMPHINMFEFPQLSYTYFGFDLRNPLFQDLRVRQAMAHAIDRETIVSELYLGHGIVAHTHGSPARWDYNPNVTTYEFNPDKARQLLADAGWTKGADDVLQKDGMTLSFRLMTNAGNKIRETAAVIMQDQLGDVGIKADVQLVEWSTFVNANLIGRDFDTIIVGWRLGSDPDAFTIWHTNGGSFNFVSYSNPKVDSLIDQGRRVVDIDQRAKIYGEMQEILAYELPYIFLFFPNSIFAVNKRIQGDMTPHPLEFFWNVEKWWIPKELQTK